MSNQNVKIIYSLKFHIALQKMGFQCLMEMKNPNNPRYNCWVYTADDKFIEAFDELMKGVQS